MPREADENASVSSYTGVEDEDESTPRGFEETTRLKASGQICKMASMIIVTSMMVSMILFVNLAFIGHIPAGPAEHDHCLALSSATACKNTPLGPKKTGLCCVWVQDTTGGQCVSNGTPFPCEDMTQAYCTSKIPGTSEDLPCQWNSNRGCQPISFSYLAAAALGIMVVNIMGFSVVIGMSSGLDTLCATAMGHAEQGHIAFSVVGGFLQKSLLIGCVAASAVCVVFWYSYNILVGLQQNPDTSMLASQYIKICMAAVWPVMLFANYRRWLQSQKIVALIFPAVLLSLGTMIGGCYLFVDDLKLGFIGAAWTIPITYWMMLFVLLAIAGLKGHYKKTAALKWSMAAFKGWGRVLRLSIPGTLMLCSEWWAFEAMALFAGTMGNSQLAGYTVTLNVLGIFLKVPLGISYACATLVGRELGKKNHEAARKTADAAIFLSFFSTLGIVAGLYFGRDKVASLYTKDPNVIVEIVDCIPFMCVYLMIDQFQRVFAGILRAMGRQNIGAMINLVSFYCCGTPLGIWLGLGPHNMQLQGLWIGSSIAATSCLIFLGIFRYRVDWEKAVERAERNVMGRRKKLSYEKVECEDETMHLQNGKNPKCLNSKRLSIRDLE